MTRITINRIRSTGVKEHALNIGPKDEQPKKPDDRLTEGRSQKFNGWKRRRGREKHLGAYLINCVYRKGNFGTAYPREEKGGAKVRVWREEPTAENRWRLDN